MLVAPCRPAAPKSRKPAEKPNDAAIFTARIKISNFARNRLAESVVREYRDRMSNSDTQTVREGVKERLEAALTRLEAATEQALADLETAKARAQEAEAKAQEAEAKVEEAGEVAGQLRALEAENTALKEEVAALGAFAADVEARLDGVIDVVQSVIAPANGTAQANEDEFHDDEEAPALELSAN